MKSQLWELDQWPSWFFYKLDFPILSKSAKAILNIEMQKMSLRNLVAYSNQNMPETLWLSRYWLCNTLEFQESEPHLCREGRRCWSCWRIWRHPYFFCSRAGIGWRWPRSRTMELWRDNPWWTFRQIWAESWHIAKASWWWFDKICMIQTWTGKCCMTTKPSISVHQLHL